MKTEARMANIVFYICVGGLIYGAAKLAAIALNGGLCR